MKKENSFLKAGAMLVVSGFVVKLLSAVYRIPLTRMLGAVNMGRYSAVLNIFMPFFSIATAGIAATTANFTAKYNKSNDPDGIYSLKIRALRMYIPISVTVCVAFIIFGKIYFSRTEDSILFVACVILAPSVIFAAMENIFKGITQGRMNMLPTAVANVLEGSIKTVFGLLGVYLVQRLYAGDKGDMSIAVSVIAVTLAGMVCTLFLYIKSRENEKQSNNNGEKIISYKAMLKMSVPIGASALMVSATVFFETAFCLPQIDKIPYAQIVHSFDGASFKGAGDMSMYLFGIWQGMVLSVFNLVPAVLASVGMAGLPLISGYWDNTDRAKLDHHTHKLFCATSRIAVPAMVFIFCFAKDILQFLFALSSAQTQVGVALLRILSLAGVFCCFNSSLNSVLYAAGRSDKVFRILLSACVARCGASYLLCGIPSVNIKAFAVSVSAFYTIIFVRSVYAIKKLGVKFSVGKIFTIPVMAAAIAILFIKWLCDAQLYSLPQFIKLFLSGTIYLSMYFLIIIMTGFLVDK